MASNSATAFQQNVRQRMKDLGLTFESLAARMGWKAPSVHAYVSGKSEPGLGVLDRFAKALETRASELIEPAEEKISV